LLSACTGRGADGRMTELKTLKDLKKTYVEDETKRTDNPISQEWNKFVELRQLRQEAIEWIKNSTDQAHWLNFFNLTEEDLK
jgi:hypothetical protein